MRSLRRGRRVLFVAGLSAVLSAGTAIGVAGIFDPPASFCADATNELQVCLNCCIDVYLDPDKRRKCNAYCYAEHGGGKR